MSKHQALKDLEQAEREAFDALMNGSEEDASTTPGKEGKNEIAWRAAADACFDYRQKHDLIGLSWDEIEASTASTSA